MQDMSLVNINHQGQDVIYVKTSILTTNVRSNICHYVNINHQGQDVIYVITSILTTKVKMQDMSLRQY